MVCGAWWRVGFVIFIALYFILFIFTYFISYFPHFPRIFSSTQRRVGRLGPKPKPVRGLEIVPACSRSGWPRHSKQQIWPLAGQTRKRLAPPRWDTNSALSTFCGLSARWVLGWQIFGQQSTFCQAEDHLRNSAHAQALSACEESARHVAVCPARQPANYSRWSVLVWPCDAARASLFPFRLFGIQVLALRRDKGIPFPMPLFGIQVLKRLRCRSCLPSPGPLP